MPVLAASGGLTGHEKTMACPTFGMGMEPQEMEIVGLAKNAKYG